MRHFVTFLLFAGAIAAYIMSGAPGAVVLVIVGVVLEFLGWYRLFRAKKQPNG
ncbi:MAG: glycosyl transferase family 39 [Rhodanobacteraceae bacterium]